MRTKHLVEIARKFKEKPSIGMLQRKLHIGYEKAEEVLKKLNEKENIRHS